MTAAVPPSAPDRPKHWRIAPRFSLRMLMVVVTAAAVGGAIWWRWPVIVTTDYGNFVTENTYHRGLWGNLIRHGSHRTSIDGKVERETQYREGELVSCEYHTGDLVLAYEYKNGKLAAAPNRPRGSPVFGRIEAAFANNPNLQTRLRAEAALDCFEWPLREVLEDLNERFGLSLAMCSKRKDLFDTPIILNVNWPMEAGLDAIISPLGLVLDCRYGALCIVDAADAAGWQDSTGVMELQSPDSLLARRLDVSVKVTFVEPILDALLNLAAEGIPVEFRSENEGASGGSSIPPGELAASPRDGPKMLTRSAGMMVVFTSPNAGPSLPKPITIRQLLGLVLDQAHLHYREEKGC